MGPLAIEMVRSMHEDRLRAAQGARLASRIKRARREAMESVVTEHRLAPATVPALRTLANAAEAVRIGDVIEVGGVAAIGADGRVRFLGDAYEQTRQALAVLGETLSRFGASMEDVVRTRVYLKKSWQWEEVSRAHGEAFGDARPATTFLGAGGFPDSDMLVSIEATAVIR
jgi:enamine deaminase RidA (YjgF/YER057c/UK114 family)